MAMIEQGRDPNDQDDDEDYEDDDNQRDDGKLETVGEGNETGHMSTS